LIARIALALFLGLLPLPARAQFDLLPGYDPPALRGPDAAAGAVIWNHGKSGTQADLFGETPFLMDAFRDAGWDVFRLHRKGTHDGEESGTRALIAHGRRLREQGYGRLVSAGQSFGGWISYLAAGRAENLFTGIVTLAAAAHGQAGQSTHWQLNADHLFAMARGIASTRVASFFFARDPYDPGGRGSKLSEILLARGLPSMMVEAPAGFEGHGVGQSLAFGRRFGPCVLAFIAAPAPTARESCEPDLTPALADFALPTTLRLDAGRDALVGRWWGWYPQGREAMLIVRNVSGHKVEAIYAWTAQNRRPSEQPGHQSRVGRLDPASGAIRFDEKGRPLIDIRQREDGLMDIHWSREDGSGAVSAVLRRID